MAERSFTLPIHVFWNGNEKRHVYLHVAFPFSISRTKALVIILSSWAVCIAKIKNMMPDGFSGPNEREKQ